MKYFDNNSFVQKTIKADSPLYRSHLRQKPSSEEMKKRYQLYNMLLRDPEAIFTFYHGTSQNIYQKILADGGFSSPKARKKEHLEQRTRGHEEVFVTTSVETADWYQNRTTEQQNALIREQFKKQQKDEHIELDKPYKPNKPIELDKPIIIEMRIPIVWLQDVSSVILKTTETQHIYTEYQGPGDIDKLLDFNKKSVKQMADDIKNYFRNAVEQKTDNEFTIRHFVSKRFIKGTSLDSINLWERWIEEKPIKYEEAIKLFPNDKELFDDAFKELKLFWLQRVKRSPWWYKKAIELFPDNKEEFYAAGKQGWLQRIQENPYLYKDAIRLFSSNDKDIYEAGKQGFLQLVKEDPRNYEDAIELFPNDKDIYEAGKQGYLDFVKRYQILWYYERAIQLFPEAKHEFDAADKIPQEQPKQSCGWYKSIKEADSFLSNIFNKNNDDSQKSLTTPKSFTIHDIADKTKLFETFRKSYEESTGSSWDANKFFSRANNWRFYGDESGYVTVREQRSGMLKLTGVAGNTKSIMRGIKELLKEHKPIWGMVSKEILDMALRLGFETPSPKDIKNNIHKIPPEVFGGAKIKQIFDDGGVQFEYADVGTARKYLIGNSQYFNKLNFIKYTPKFLLDKFNKKKEL